ncbi:MAG: hypothetical protein M3322_02040 [Actinomycetota bacterium]|nr:hypothetical protein [Actinomycetota bacterium]
MRELWLPGMEGPHEDFVARLHREIERFAREREIPHAAVEIELRDGSRYPVERISPEPGYGFITLSLLPGEEGPDGLIVPIAAISRIELSVAAEEREGFGFSLPDASSASPG